MKKISLLLLVALLMIGCAGRGEPEDYRNGLMALKNKDYEKGIEFLAKVVELQAGTIYAAEALYHMGWAYHRGLMDLEQAEECYRQYLGNFPEHGRRKESLHGLADCLYWQNRFADALEIYGRLRERAPELQWVPYQVVMCHYHLGQYEECRRLARDFVKTSPEAAYVPSMLYRIANSYEVQEDWAAARDSYEQLKENYPLHRLSRSAKRDLVRLEKLLPPEEKTPAEEAAPAKGGAEK